MATYNILEAFLYPTNSRCIILIFTRVFLASCICEQESQSRDPGAQAGSKLFERKAMERVRVEKNRVVALSRIIALCLLDELHHHTEPIVLLPQTHFC